MRKWISLYLCAALLLLCACNGANGGTAQAPASQGAAVAGSSQPMPGAGRFQGLDETLAAQPVNACLIVENGSEVYSYFAGRYNRDSSFLFFSCSKSVTSAVVGLAIQQGYIAGLDEPIGSYYPKLAEDVDPRKAQITIGQLLSMTEGFDWPEWTEWEYRFDEWEQAENMVDFILERELANEPGAVFNYNTGSFHLLADILHKATGEDMLTYARRELFDPLGMQSVEWPADNQGVVTGGYGIRMSAADAALFAQLYLNGGAWEGRQLLEGCWVSQTTAVHSVGDGAEYGDYGYGWWSRELAGTRIFYALGFGGQYILISPEHNALAVFASSAWYGPHPDVFTYFADYVLRAE